MSNIKRVFDLTGIPRETRERPDLGCTKIYGDNTEFSQQQFHDPSLEIIGPVTKEGVAQTLRGDYILIGDSPDQCNVYEILGIYGRYLDFSFTEFELEGVEIPGGLIELVAMQNVSLPQHLAKCRREGGVSNSVTSATETKKIASLYDLSNFPFFLYRAGGSGRWAVCSDYRGFDTERFPPGSIGKGSRAAGLTPSIEQALLDAGVAANMQYTLAESRSIVLFGLKEPVRNVAEPGDYMMFWVDDGSDSKLLENAIVICIDRIRRCSDTGLPYFEAFGNEMTGGLRGLLGSSSMPNRYQ